MSEITFKADDRVMIVGIPDMGKSVLFLSFVKKLCNKGFRVLLYDSELNTNLEAKKLTVYKPQRPGNKEEFEHICEQVWERVDSDRPIHVLAVESIDFYASPQTDLDHELPFFKKVLHWGRNKDLGVIMTSRRIANCHKDTCALSVHWFLFYTFLPNDIKYIRSFIGRTADDIPKLQPHHFIHFESGGKVTFCNPIPYEGSP